MNRPGKGGIVTAAVIAFVVGVLLIALGRLVAEAVPEQDGRWVAQLFAGILGGLVAGGLYVRLKHAFYNEPMRLWDAEQKVIFMEEQEKLKAMIDGLSAKSDALSEAEAERAAEEFLLGEGALRLRPRR